MTGTEILVLGIGNYLLGDEGVGVHAIRRLEKEAWPRRVRLVDGGTGGFHLLSFFSDYDIVIMIDAAMDDGDPGTVHLLEPHFASDFPRALSAHDIGLRDLIESAVLLGPLPKIYLITVSIAQPQSMQMELSPAIAASLPGVVQRVKSLVRSIGRGTSAGAGV
jgi:hydrogenase maturation protease